MTLWTSAEIALAVDALYSDNFNVTGVSIDTRTIKPGELFVALDGPNFNGHDFVEEAMLAGAAGIISTKKTYVPSIKVSNTFNALTNLAAAARKRFKGEVIAITGSVGKTTTKELTASAKEAYATKGNLNNHIGVPLTLANIPLDAKAAVIEIGMNHFGEIGALSRLTRPTHAIITAIDWVHSENLDGTLAGVAKAKTEILEGLTGPLYAPISIKELIEPYLGQQLVHWIGTPYDGPMQLEGPEHRWNAALALATVKNDMAGAESRLARVKPTAGRGKQQSLMIDGKRICLIDDSYNASPASMRAALKNLASHTCGRKIAIIGDMAELAHAKHHHQELGIFISTLTIDLLMAIGHFHPEIVEQLPQSATSIGLPSAKDAFVTIRSQLQDGDTVLIKASNSTGLSRVVRDLIAANDAL